MERIELEIEIGNRPAGPENVLYFRKFDHNFVKIRKFDFNFASFIVRYNEFDEDVSAFFFVKYRNFTKSDENPILYLYVTNDSTIHYAWCQLEHKQRALQHTAVQDHLDY